MANAFAQIGAVTAMNVRNIPQRWSSSLVAVLGIGGVTLVLVALLSIAAGFRVALEGSGSDDVAMVMRSGSNNEMSSFFSIEQVTAVTNAPNILRNSKNEPLISPEVYGVVNAPLRGKDTTRKSAAARRGGERAPDAQGIQDRSGPDVQAGYYRTHRRRWRDEAVHRARRRQQGSTDFDGLDCGRPIHRQRRARRVGSLD